MLIILAIIMVIVFSIAKIPKGKRGEMEVVLMKKFALDPAIYVDINNVTIETTTGTTQIDHIIISKYGIFVIETKNMSGWIFGSVDQPQWTQSLPGGRKFKFQNPLRQNYRHTKSLGEFLGVDHDHIHSIVIFIGDSKFKTPMPPNVLNGGYIPYIKSKSQVLFMENDVSLMVNALRSGMMKQSPKTEKEHLDSLHVRHHSMTCCPKCGGNLALRSVKRGPDAGRQFYGCKKYPACRYTRSV